MKVTATMELPRDGGQPGVSVLGKGATNTILRQRTHSGKGSGYTHTQGISRTELGQFQLQ